jgi:hypothetical protein
VNMHFPFAVEAFLKLTPLSGSPSIPVNRKQGWHAENRRLRMKLISLPSLLIYARAFTSSAGEPQSPGIDTETELSLSVLE